MFRFADWIRVRTASRTRLSARGRSVAGDWAASCVRGEDDTVFVRITFLRQLVGSQTTRRSSVRLEHEMAATISGFRFLISLGKPGARVPPLLKLLIEMPELIAHDYKSP